MQSERVRKIAVEGFRPEEIVALPDDQIHEYVFQGDRVVFMVGDAELYGHFHRENEKLVANLYKVGPGGEEIIPSVAALLSRYARMRQIPCIEWLVSDVAALQRSEKLRAMLVQRGFTLAEDTNAGVLYRLDQKVDA